MGWQAGEEQGGAGEAQLEERLPGSFGGVFLRQMELKRAEARKGPVQSEMAGQVGSSGASTFQTTGSSGPRSGIDGLRSSRSVDAGTGLFSCHEYEGSGSGQFRRLHAEQRNQRSAGACTFSI